MSGFVTHFLFGLGLILILIRSLRIIGSNSYCIRGLSHSAAKIYMAVNVDLGL